MFQPTLKMFYIITLCIICIVVGSGLFCYQCHAASGPRVTVPRGTVHFPEQLLSAIRFVESGGHAKPREAVGDNGKALGPFQIHKEVVIDVNRIYGTNYVWEKDAKEPFASARICILYLLYWGQPALLGREPDWEDYARIWNGGPQGWKKTATLGYWLKIQRQLAPPDSKINQLMISAEVPGKGSP